MQIRSCPGANDTRVLEKEGGRRGMSVSTDSLLLINKWFAHPVAFSQDLGKPIQEVNQNSKLASKNFIKKGRNELARVEHT